MTAEVKPTKKQRTRAEIIAAATRCLEEKTWQDISMEEVAATANVVRSTLFNHFSTKAELFEAVVDEWIARLDDWHISDAGPWAIFRLFKAFEAGIEPQMDAFERIVELRIEVESHRNILVVIDDPTHDAVATRLVDSLKRIITATLSRAFERGDIEKDLPGGMLKVRDLLFDLLMQISRNEGPDALRHFETVIPLIWGYALPDRSES